MPESILETWEGIPIPSEEQGLAAARVHGTNSWIFKDHEGSLGLVLFGVHPPTGATLNFENISIIHRAEKIIHTEGTDHSVDNCLEIHLDPSCRADLLASVLDRMATYEPSGQYKTTLLLEVLSQVTRLFKRPKRPPSKEEVVGAWGELAILEVALASSPTPEETQRRITCWESFSGREKIDFRFPHIAGGVAVEVKTSSSGREHHINGMGQVTVPEEYEHGWLASLQVREVDGTSGSTAADIVRRIEERFSGSGPEITEQIRAFNERLDVRGPACSDERFFFMLPDLGLRVIEMSDVPRPGLAPGISDVEWVADLSEAPFVSSLDLSA